MIAFRDVGKVYRSVLRRQAVQAVEALTFDVTAGEIFGIAGPNGAGKSTLINLALGFIRPTTGSVSVGGLGPRAWVESRGSGYLPELVALPPSWTVATALARVACLTRIPPRLRASRIDEVIDALGIGEYRTRRVRQLSKGNLQRLGLAQVLLSDSDLVILDEPTHGLDPVWIQRFRALARGLKREGRVVVIASHYLDELERVADRVAIMDRGRLQRIVPITRAHGTAPTVWRLLVSEGADRVRSVFPGAMDIDGSAGGFRLSDLSAADLNVGLRRLLDAGVCVVGLAVEHSQLEATFQQVVGGDQ